MIQRESITRAFSLVLLEARRAAGLSQRALAAAAGFDQSFIVRMEKGLRLPALEALIALESALKLPAGGLTKLTSDELSDLSFRSDGAPDLSGCNTKNVEETGNDEIEGETLPL